MADRVANASTASSEIHDHDVYCRIIARARINMMNAEARMRRDIIMAHRNYIEEIERNVRYLEARIIDPPRRALGDITNVQSDPLPPLRLRRQHGGVIEQENMEDLEGLE